MGSLSSQLTTVSEIWPAKVGPYGHFFAKMYGKSGKKIQQFSAKNRKNSTPNHFLGPKMGSDLGLMALHNRKVQIFDFSIFFQIMAIFRSKNCQNFIFWPKKGHNLEKNQKIKNLHLAIVEGHETKVWAHFWPQKVIWCWVFSIFSQKLLTFFPDFPYIFAKKCA